MTDTVERLKELAEAVLAACWAMSEINGRERLAEYEEQKKIADKALEAFEDCASPEAILSLIAERDEARAEASKWETIAKRLANIEPQIDSLKQQLATAYRALPPNEEPAPFELAAACKDFFEAELDRAKDEILTLKQQLADYESRSDNWLDFEQKAEARGREKALEEAAVWIRTKPPPTHAMKERTGDE